MPPRRAPGKPRYQTAAARPPLPGSAVTHALGLAAPLLLPPILLGTRAVLPTRRRTATTGPGRSGDDT